MCFRSLSVGNGIVQNERAHPFQNFDSAGPSFFRRSQQRLITLVGLVVDRGDELVLHLYDAVRHLGARSLQKADDDCRFV